MCARISPTWSIFTAMRDAHKIKEKWNSNAIEYKLNVWQQPAFCSGVWIYRLILSIANVIMNISILRIPLCAPVLQQTNESHEPFATLTFRTHTHYLFRSLELASETEFSHLKPIPQQQTKTEAEITRKCALSFTAKINRTDFATNGNKLCAFSTFPPRKHYQKIVGILHLPPVQRFYRCN